MRKIRCRDGTIKSVPDDYSLQDGESLATPLFMMDGNGNDPLALHKPGFRVCDNDALTKDADAAYGEMVNHMSNA
jgi:hypothetical protein